MLLFCHAPSPCEQTQWLGLPFLLLVTPPSEVFLLAPSQQKLWRCGHIVAGKVISVNSDSPMLLHRSAVLAFWLFRVLCVVVVVVEEADVSSTTGLSL